MWGRAEGASTAASAGAACTGWLLLVAVMVRGGEMCAAGEQCLLPIRATTPAVTVKSDNCLNCSVLQQLDEDRPCPLCPVKHTRTSTPRLSSPQLLPAEPLQI